MSEEHNERHDPVNMKSRQGCWTTCSCGWRSATWTTIAAAHANFGRHLTLVAAPQPEPEEEGS
jgi:hypothetical protein